MIGISSNQKGLFPRLIRFFTSSQYTHTFITFIDIQGEASVIEAGQIVQIVPFSTHYENYKDGIYFLYELNHEGLNKEELLIAIEFLFREFSGQQYGYFQLVWFVYRWLMLKLFNKKVTASENWFTSGIICSELVYNYLYQIGSPYKELLSEFNANTINAQDIVEMLIKNPHLFTPFDLKRS